MRRVLILLFLFIATSVAATERLAMLKPCEPDATMLCGTLQVPESRATRGTRKIALKVAVIPAKDGAADPMFVLTGGGPGIASIPEAKAWSEAFPEIAASRDLVFFDQRGTGGSNALDCSISGAGSAARAFLGGDIPPGIVRECREQLSKGADLAAYTTIETARDLDDIRAWLGYERLNLYGASYTSRLAIVYAQRYPKRVRTVTIKAAMPFSLRNPLFAAADAQSALDRLFADCEKEAACREKYPDLRGQFAAALDRLEKKPAEVAMQGGSLELTRDIFAGVIRRLLYGADTQALVPFAIVSAAQGEYAPIRPVLQAGEMIDRVLNLGLFLSVSCAEDVSQFSEADAVKAARGTFSGPGLATALVRACREWHVPAARYEAGKRAGVDALIISGLLDPAAPPRWGRETAALFPRALHLEVEGVAHSGSPKCVRDVISRFVLAGTAKALDVGCVQEMKRPPFVIR
jgi:pimeloyl-ACP methyl ester carboxylesterase